MMKRLLVLILMLGCSSAPAPTTLYDVYVPDEEQAIIGHALVDAIDFWDSHGFSCRPQPFMRFQSQSEFALHQARPTTLAFFAPRENTIYYDINKIRANRSPEKFKELLTHVIIHELAHAAGALHIDNEGCIMNAVVFPDATIPDQLCEESQLMIETGCQVLDL